MNNAEFYNELEKLVYTYLDESIPMSMYNCETFKLEISKKISDLIFNRDKNDWAGEEMLGKMILNLMEEVIDG